MTGSHLAEVHEELERWVADGLLAADTAARIEAAEAAREVIPRPGTSPRSLVVEALGYLGGILALIAGTVAIRQLWPDMTEGAGAVFAGAGFLVLLICGLAVRADADPAFERLRSVLWLLATVSFAGCAGLCVDVWWDLTAAQTVLVVSLSVSVVAAVLWLVDRAPLQQLALFASVTTVAGASMACLDDSLLPWSAGLAVWVLAVAWGAVGLRSNLLEPRAIALLAAAAGMVIGSIMTMTVAAGNVLALVTVAALLTAGVLLRQVWLVGVGALAALIIVPSTAARYLPTTVAAPLSMFFVGLVMLGVALWLARRKKPDS